MTPAEKAGLLSRYAAADPSPWIELAQRIGVHALDEVLGMFGGERVSVPSQSEFWATLSRQHRDLVIRRGFHAGVSIADLAERHGISRREAQRIVYGRGRRSR